MNGRKIIITENNEFGNECKKKHVKNAIKCIKESESFILITKTKEGGEAVSCIENIRHMIGLAYGCHEIEKEILKTFKEITERNDLP